MSVPVPMMSIAPESPFEVNFGLFFWTWLIFIALFLLLKKYAWPAIVKATEAREQAIEHQLREAETLNSEAKANVAEQQQRLGEARSQAQELVTEAKRVADRERAAAVEKTKQEQSAMRDRAKRDIVAEREKAWRELRAEAVDLSLAAASKLVEQRLDSEDDRRLVEGYLASLEASR